MLFVAGCAGTPSTLPQTGQPAAPVFDVPRLDGIAIDGKGGDWGDRGFRVDVLTSYNRPLRPPQDQDCFFRLGWNERGLLVLATMSDNKWVESKENILLGRDRIEMGLRTVDALDICHWNISPGMADDEPNLRYFFDDARKDPRLKGLPAQIEIARTRSGNQCIVEALLPWSSLSITPREGQEVFFHLWTADSDDPAESDEYWLTWYPAIGADFWRRGESHRIRLSSAPSGPVTARASAQYVPDRLRTEVTVRALGGRVASVHEGDATLASFPLVPAGRLVEARVSFPLPPAGSTYAPLTIEIDGRAADRLALPDFRPIRQDAIDAIGLVAKPCIFSQRNFPPVEFENPVLAESLIGSYTLKVRYYDAAFHEVHSADNPGRYGAIVEIQPEKGRLSRRFLTLFRTASPIHWSQWEDAGVDGNVILPAGLGLRPEVLRSGRKYLSDFLTGQVLSWSYQDSEPAVVMAGLFEADANAPALARNSPQRADQRWWFDLRTKTNTLEVYEYGVHLPKGFDPNSGKRVPAILYLHGSGERGAGVKGVLDASGAVRYARRHEDLPFLVIVPHCPLHTNWKPVLVKAVLDDAMKKYPVDPDRVYLTGVSMGGYGAWGVAAEYPGVFAAVAPVCGAGDPQDVQRLKDVPIWIFHSDDDDTVPVKGSDAMFAALKAIGGRVRYTRPTGMGHMVHPVAYYGDALYEWLLQQTKGRPQQPPATPQTAAVTK
jgi:pimeloyl-ACP methyl ester carboxylesterase